jgi:phosphopantetheinyl transferase
MSGSINASVPETDYTVYIAPFTQRKDSHTLLELAAHCHAGLAGDELELAIEQRGKPYFPRAPHVHFSLTHSGAYWMCAFGRRPVGLDLQKHESCSRERLSRRFFHTAEDDFLRGCGYDAFFSVWSAKESYLKYTGQGMPGGLSAFSVVADGAIADRTMGAQLRFLPFLPDYSLCLCAESIGRVFLTDNWNRVGG